MSDAPRRQRLTRSADFDRVYRQGRSYQHRLLVVYRFERPEDIAGDALHMQSRIGITVSKRLGNAVERNRLKRQLRDSVDRSGFVPDGAADFVLIARPGLQAAIDAHGFEWLQELVCELLGRGEPQKPSRRRKPAGADPAQGSLREGAAAVPMAPEATEPSLGKPATDGDPGAEVEVAVVDDDIDPLEALARETQIGHEDHGDRSDPPRGLGE